METAQLASNDTNDTEENKPPVETVIAELEVVDRIEPAVREFSKRYSSSGRKKISDEILAIRTLFFEKEKGNQERFDSIKSNEAEIELLQKRLKAIENELEREKAELEVRNSKLWSKLTDLFRKEELAQELNIKEKLQSLDSMKKQLEERYLLINQAESVIIDTSKLDEAKDKLRQFYAEQSELKAIYESEEQERGVAGISKNEGVLFLHGLPTLERPMNETSENNQVVDTHALDTDSKLKLLIGLGPTISASAIKLGDESSSTFYPFGVILNKGKVVSAYNEDAGTTTEGLYSRRSKYDKETERTAIQKNSAEKLKASVTADPKNRKWGAHNEIVIENPEVSALYVNISGRDHYKPISIAELKKYSEELDLPVFALHKGKLYPFNVVDKFTTRASGRIVENEDAFTINGEPIDAIEAVKAGASFTAEDKLAFAQKAIEQFPFLIDSKDKKLIEAYQKDPRHPYGGVDGYGNFIRTAELYAIQKKSGFAMVSNPGTFPDFLRQSRDDLSEWKKKAEGTDSEQKDNKSLNSRRRRNFSKQQLEVRIFNLYGFAKGAEKQGDKVTAEEALAVIEEFYPVAKCEELITKRIDENGKFKILDEDVPKDVKARIGELRGKIES